MNLYMDFFKQTSYGVILGGITITSTAFFTGSAAIAMTGILIASTGYGGQLWWEMIDTILRCSDTERNYEQNKTR